MKKQILASTIISVFSAAGMLMSTGASAHVSIGDEASGGVKYHLNFAVHHADTNYTAASGQTLGTVGTFGTGGTGTDSSTDGIVDTVGSKSWHDLGRLGGSSTAPVAAGEYGWTHSSRWGLIDLNDLYADGITQVKVTVMLERDGVGAASDLIPGLTVWQGREDLGNYSAMYVNGSTSTNWSDWNGGGACSPAGTCSYFPTLAQAGAAGNVWLAADSSSNPTGKATVVIGLLNLAAGGNNYLTAVFGGNEALASQGGPATGHAVNFKATVRVEAVPVPAAVWLFGSALSAFGLFRRRSRSA